VIGVGVRKDHVFHILRVQPDFLQTIQNFVSRGVLEKGLDDDNSLAADDGPRAVDFGAQEI
jgi:hypothetical protein